MRKRADLKLRYPERKRETTMKPDKKIKTTRLSVSRLIKDGQYDKALIIELEKERLFPNRRVRGLFGQFVLLYEVIPPILFNTILMKEEELRGYFKKFLINVKKKDLEGEESLLAMSHLFLEKIDLHPSYYLINSKHRLTELDT